MRTHDSPEKQVAQGCTEGWRNWERQCRRWTAVISEWTGLKSWTSTMQQHWLKTEES